MNTAIRYSLFLLILISTASHAWHGGQNRNSEKEAAMHLTSNLENGKKIYQLCTHCHAQDGLGFIKSLSQRNTPGYYPILAGQHKKVLIKQLSDIRSGNRDNPQMYPFTLNKYIGGPQDIADVTGYIASLPTQNNINNIGPGLDLVLGEKLYKKNCTTCNNENAIGSNDDFYPRLQGQHFNYMLRQFRWIKDGKRRNANSKMRKQIQNFSYKEMRAVIDYVSRITPSTKKEK